MLRLCFAASLSALLPARERGGTHTRVVLEHANTWSDAVTEIRARYPALADRVLTPAGAVRAGFLLAVNDAIDPTNGAAARIRSGDELFFFVQIAGG